MKIVAVTMAKAELKDHHGRRPRLRGPGYLPESYFQSNHAIQVGDFANVLLSDRGLMLDQDNGLWTHPVAQKERVALSPVRTQTVEHYAIEELGVHGLGDYEIITPNIGRVFDQWNFRASGAPSMEAALAQEMRSNPALRLMVVQGRYDTLTQVGDTLYILDQTDIPRARLTMTYFDGGHMLEPKPEAMRAIRAFLSFASPAAAAQGDRP